MNTAATVLRWVDAGIAMGCLLVMAARFWEWWLADRRTRFEGLAYALLVLAVGLGSAEAATEHIRGGFRVYLTTASLLVLLVALLPLPRGWIRRCRTTLLRARLARLHRT